MRSRRLMAVDPSLTCSGWALFSISSGKLLAVGKIKSLSSALPMARRLQDLQGKIVDVLQELELSASDVLICEAETTMRDPRAAFKVEQVRGIFETMARSLKTSVPGRINPRSVHYEIMGLRGKQLERKAIKEAAISIVHSLYLEPLRKIGFEGAPAQLKQHQDIVDAILIGSLALTRVQSAERAGISLDEFFDRRKMR